MNESERWTVKCQDTADGRGDVIVDLPPELLAKLGLEVADDLTITTTKDAIVLRPNHAPSQCGYSLGAPKVSKYIVENQGWFSQIDW